jgi:hypothetical protein
MVRINQQKKIKNLLMKLGVIVWLSVTMIFRVVIEFIEN